MMKSIAMISLVLASAPAFSQDAFDKHASNVALLQMKPVQKELGVTEAQRAKMNVAAAAYSKEMTALSKTIQQAAEKKAKPPADANKRASTALARLNASVLQQLSASQLKRLREISLQAAGAAALADDAVGKRVGLSADQIKKVRSIYTAALKSAAELEQRAMQTALKDIRDKKPKNDAEAKKLYEEAQRRAQKVREQTAPQSNKIRVGAESKALALLSASQRGAWVALLGKKYSMPSS